jgi:chemotaxis signal transduction protein
MITNSLDGLICCIVGDQQYAVRRDDVQTVARADDVRADPTRPDTVGTLGDGLPVFRLSRLLDRSDGAVSAGRHVIVTRGDGSSFGLLVDQIVRTPAVAHAEIRQLPAIVGPLPVARFRGLLTSEEVSCLILAPGALDPAAPLQRRAVSHPPAPASAGAATGVRHAIANSVVIFSSAALSRRRDVRYALDARRISALVQSLPTVAVPGSPPYVKALGWWRESVVPVLDFARNTAPPPDASSRYLIVRTGRYFDHALVALPIGRDITLHRATGDDRLVASTGSARGAIRGMFTVGQERVALLDLDRLIADAGNLDGGNGQTV